MNERLRDVMGGTFGVPASDIPVEAALGEYGPWDSVGHLDLMLAVEQEFGVQIPSETMLQLTTSQAIESYLNSR
jgi:acyl carrier protein